MGFRVPFWEPGFRGLGLNGFGLWADKAESFTGAMAAVSIQGIVEALRPLPELSGMLQTKQYKASANPEQKPQTLNLNRHRVRV